jgi:hypothetical protein
LKDVRVDFAQVIEIEIAVDGLLGELNDAEGGEVALELIQQVLICDPGLVLQNSGAGHAVGVIRLLA